MPKSLYDASGIAVVLYGNFLDLYFIVFGLNKEIYLFEHGIIRTRKTPNSETFHAVIKMCFYPK